MHTPAWRKRAVKTICRCWKTHIIKDPIFQCDLKKITRKQIKSYLRTLSTATSESTAEKAHVVMCRVFEEAVEDEIIGENPARGLHGSIFKDRKRRNRKNKFKANPLVLEERGLFLKTAQQICCLAKLMILQIMVFGGLRLGEALALHVRHLNFDNLTIFIEKSFRKGQFKRPKFNSVRTVHLPKFLMDALNAYIEQKGLKLNDLLFQDPKLKKKQPFSQRKIQYIVEVICKKAGLKKIRSPRFAPHVCISLADGAPEHPVRAGATGSHLHPDDQGHLLPVDILPGGGSSWKKR
jgi:integrase